MRFAFVYLATFLLLAFLAWVAGQFVLGLVLDGAPVWLMTLYVALAVVLVSWGVARVVDSSTAHEGAEADVAEVFE